MTRAGHDASPKLSAESSAAELKIGIVMSRFNSVITDRLLRGALEALEGAKGESVAGVARENIEIVSVPGSLELPIAATKMVEARRPDAVICIGCVLRGETSHYDLVCSEVARGVQLAQLDTGTPMIFCVLTCHTLEQAMVRSGEKSGNKGFEAGIAAVEMANLCRKFNAAKASESKAVTAEQSGETVQQKAAAHGAKRRSNGRGRC